MIQNKEVYLYYYVMNKSQIYDNFLKNKVDVVVFIIFLGFLISQRWNPLFYMMTIKVIYF